GQIRPPRPARGRPPQPCPGAGHRVPARRGCEPDARAARLARTRRRGRARRAAGAARSAAPADHSGRWAGGLRSIAARRVRRAGGGTGCTARRRTRDLSLCHVVQYDRGRRGGGGWDRAHGDRRRARRGKGVHDAGGERPLPTEAEPALAERVRELGGEFGATTGRPRRCGWFDAVVVRYAVRVNGLTGLAVTKLDVLDSFREIPVGVGYRLDGEVVDS